MGGLHGRKRNLILSPDPSTFVTVVGCCLVLGVAAYVMGWRANVALIAAAAAAVTTGAPFVAIMVGFAVRFLLGAKRD